MNVAGVTERRIKPISARAVSMATRRTRILDAAGEVIAGRGIELFNEPNEHVKTVPGHTHRWQNEAPDSGTRYS